MRPARLHSFRQGRRQINLGAAADCAGSITNFIENPEGKSLFFLSRLKGDLFLNFCDYHKKRYDQENIPFVKSRQVCVLESENLEKRTVSSTCVFSSICILV